MSAFPFTAMDVAALVVVGLSVLVALVRGATREMLSLATWIGAAAAAFYGFPYARELARRTIETPWMADAAALCVAFVVPLIALKIVAAVLAGHIPGGTFGTIDRTLGVVFGVARGAVVVCAAYLGLTILVGPDDLPDWVQQAVVLPYVQDGAALLNRLMPADLGAAGRDAMAEIERRGEALHQMGGAVRELTTP